MFQGNLGDNSRKHHTFVTINSDFENAGLNQFTLSYLYSFCKGNHSEIKKLNFVSSEIKDLFLSAKQAEDEDSFINSFFTKIDSAYYYKFNKTSGQFEKTNFDKSKILYTITEFEKVKTQKSYKNNTIIETVRDIQLSSEKYALLKSTINITVGETQIPIEFKLYFKDSIDTFTGQRLMAASSSNLVTGPPKRSTGGIWGAASTNNIGDKQDNIGVYASPSSLNSTVEHKVGEVDYTWNSNTGKWESGTKQIMAKLLTNIDKAPIKNVSIKSTDTANGKKFYDPTSNNYMGSFTTGLAVPLSVENGNPHLFGPNCLQCTGGEQKIEKIRVINRAPRSFKKDATVLCSRIDGEWIIQDFGFNPDDAAPSETSNGEWSFIKLIANSDDYFKDNRYVVADGRTVNIDTSKKANISPDTYETKMRNRFYAHLSAIAGGDIVPPITNNMMLSDIQNIYPNILSQIGLQKTIRYNGFPSVSGKLIDTKPDLYSIKTDSYDFDPNKKYFVSTVFDQLGPQMGGNAPENFISRTNIYNTTAIVDNRRQAIPFSFFWGAVFPDGYKNEDVARVSLYSNRLDETLVFETNNDKYFTDANIVDPFSVNSAFLTGADLFSNDTVNGKEIPAEVGVLSSGNGIEDITAIMNYSIDKNFVEHIRNILTPNRFAYLLDSEQLDVYNMNPVSPNKIQFTPLHAEFAGHADAYTKYLTANAKTWQRDFFNNTRSLLKETYSQLPHFWGKMFDRFVGPITYYKNPQFPQTQRDGLDDPSQTYNQSQNLVVEEFNNVPYDFYINSTPTSKPKGITRLFHDANSDFQGANLVGVIAAKNKFTKTGGGKINYSIEQFFGLIGDTSNATTQSDIQYNMFGLAALALITSLTGATPSNRNKAGLATWGSDNADKYDSFGTTALHVRVFDAWPNEQTIFDARYYAVLHFNPGTILSIPESETVGDNPETITAKFGKKYTEWDTSNSENYRKASASSFNYSRSIDKIKYDVDFRIPTYAWPFSEGNDNKIVPAETNINKDTILRPAEEWRVNPIRRGQLLTGGGFRYLKNVIGLAYEGYFIANSGKGFVKDKKYTISTSNTDIVIIITDVGDDGSIKEFEFAVDEDNNELRGTELLPSDFASKSTINDIEYTGYLLTIPNSDGEDADICFPNGRVYQLLMKDEGPKERKAPTLLTSPSEDGRAVVEGTITSSIDIAANSDGQYDAFYFFHNDITHTPTLERNDTYSVGIEQYITVTIT
jgi:hypothetical protein